MPGPATRLGFLSHTYTFEDVEYKVNGVPFNESMILAAGAARLKIPLVMVSGDDQLEKEIRREMPWVRYASIKHAVDRTKAEALPREEASRRIEAAAREGLEKLAEAKLPDWPPPYRFALTFQDETQARAAALVPGAQLLSNPLSVQIRVNDFEEGYRLSIRLIGLAGIVSQGETLRGVLNVQPNAAQLRVNTTDWLYDRFLDRLPPPAQPAAGQRQRYWGAR